MNDLLALVASLSQAEKRQFKLANKKLSMPVAYMHLFDLIQKNRYRDKETISEKFLLRYPDASVESSSRYLYKLVLEALVENKVRNEERYKMMQSLLQIKVLKERNLHENAQALVKSNQLLAEKYNELPILYALRREELHYLSENNFPAIKEKELIAKQMAARDLLREMRDIQEHQTLYELLKHRLSNSSQALSEKSRSALNDLVLSEIAIINNKNRQSLESKRLHLLFQSFYFIKTGDYRSALRTFHILNELYEKKLVSLQHPPVDYFSMLDGILDSLRMIGHYQEMEYFLEKLNALSTGDYPEYFRLMVKKTALLSQLNMAANAGEWKQAIALVNQADPEIIRQDRILTRQKHGELLFYISLVYHSCGQTKKAIKLINTIVLSRQADFSDQRYRLARLFNLVMNYEQREVEYLDYEMRAYKRIFKGKLSMLMLEKLLFKIIRIDPHSLSKYSTRAEWEKLLPLVHSIREDKDESRMLRYFDFLQWAEKLFVK